MMKGFVIPLLVPLGSNVPAYRRAYVTWTIIIINAIVFVATLIEPEEIAQHYALHYHEPEPYQYLTHAFLHADFFHIFFNMYIFWLFGVGLENKIGWWRFLVLYGLTAIGGGMAHNYLWSPPATQLAQANILLGASGAVYGIMGAFITIFPFSTIRCFFLLTVVGFPIQMKKVNVAAIWFLPVLWIIDLIVKLTALNFMLVVESNVAHMAHLGGLALGVGLAAAVYGFYGFSAEAEDDQFQERKIEKELSERLKTDRLNAILEHDATENHGKPKWGQMLQNLHVYVVKNEATEAAVLYSRMLQEKPRITLPVNSQFEMANLFYNNREYQLARQAYDNLLCVYTEDPIVPRAKLELARVLIRLHDEPERAKALLEDFLATEPPRDLEAEGKKLLEKLHPKSPPPRHSPVDTTAWDERTPPPSAFDTGEFLNLFPEDGFVGGNAKSKESRPLESAQPSDLLDEQIEHFQEDPDVGIAPEDLKPEVWRQEDESLGHYLRRTQKVFDNPEDSEAFFINLKQEDDPHKWDPKLSNEPDDPIHMDLRSDSQSGAQQPPNKKIPPPSPEDHAKPPAAEEAGDAESSSEPISLSVEPPKPAKAKSPSPPPSRTPTPQKEPSPPKPRKTQEGYQDPFALVDDGRPAKTNSDPRIDLSSLAPLDLDLDEGEAHTSASVMRGVEGTRHNLEQATDLRDTHPPLVLAPNHRYSLILAPGRSVNFRIINGALSPVLGLSPKSTHHAILRRRGVLLSDLDHQTAKKLAQRLADQGQSVALVEDGPIIDFGIPRDAFSLKMDVRGIEVATEVARIKFIWNEVVAIGGGLVQLAPGSPYRSVIDLFVREPRLHLRIWENTFQFPSGPTTHRHQRFLKLAQQLVELTPNAIHTRTLDLWLRQDYNATDIHFASMIEYDNFTRWHLMAYYAPIILFDKH